MNPIEILNLEFAPFGLDPALTRLAFTLIVAGAIFHWVRDVRRFWVDTWTRRTRRINSAMLSVILVNAALLLSAAQREDPLRVGTWLLAASFVFLNGAMLYAPRNDNSYDRQYAHLLPRRLR